MTTISIPTVFYNDHVARDLPGGKVVRVGRVYSEVDLDRASWLDLASDAALYDGFVGDDYRENRRVCDSATRTLARLKMFDPPAAAILGVCQRSYGHGQVCGEDVYDDTDGICAHCGTPINQETT